MERLQGFCCSDNVRIKNKHCIKWWFFVCERFDCKWTFGRAAVQLAVIESYFFPFYIHLKMDYYRSHESDGALPSTSADGNLLNMASDSYAPDYWNIPYSNGLSPMKQIEGKWHATLC